MVGAPSPIAPKPMEPHMRCLFLLVCVVLLAAPAASAVQPFPASFRTQKIDTNGTRYYVRTSGTGPAVLLAHGFGDTGDMWAPIAARLAKDHTVIVPDLRGMGLSDHAETGYTKKNQARDLAGVLDRLKIDKADLVTHDIGNMVGYAFAAQYPDRVTRWVVIDAPLPGIGDWENIIRSPLLTMPILAVGAEKSFGAAQAEDIRFVATNVESAIVPGSGHWVMEENPQATTKLVLEFLAK